MSTYRDFKSSHMAMETVDKNTVIIGPFIIDFSSIAWDTVLQHLRWLIPTQPYKMLKNRLLSRINRAKLR